jgi:hypothetical protein
MCHSAVQLPRSNSSSNSPCHFQSSDNWNTSHRHTGYLHSSQWLHINNINFTLNFEILLYSVQVAQAHKRVTGSVNSCINTMNSDAATYAPSTIDKVDCEL